MPESTDNIAAGAYLESRILSMKPTDLTRLLFERVVDQVGVSRRALSSADALARAVAVSQAMAALNELIASLDATQNPDYVARAMRIYGYLQFQLAEAHARQSDEIFGRVEQTVSVMHQNWIETCALLESAAREDELRHSSEPEQREGGGWEA